MRKIVGAAALVCAAATSATADNTLSGFTTEAVVVTTYALGATVVGGGGFGPAGGRLAAERPQFTNLTVSRFSDGSSPLFLKDLAQGRGKRAVLRAVGEDPAAEVVITMEGARVQSYQVSGEVAQEERITIGFTKLQLQVGTEKFCYDIARAQTCDTPL